MLPYVNLRPPFNITRSSHVRLTVADLAESRDFYTNVLGPGRQRRGRLRLSTCAVWPRPATTASCWSRRREGGTCRRIGFRVFFDEDLDVGLPTTSARPGPARRVGRRAVPGPDPARERSDRHAARAVRDHGDPAAAAHRLRAVQGRSRAAAGPLPDPGAGHLRAVRVLQRPRASATPSTSSTATSCSARSCTARAPASTWRSSPVTGPRLHHFAYTVSESHDIFTACDFAGILGYGDGGRARPRTARPGRHAVRLPARPRRAPGRGLQQPLPDHRHRDRAGALGRGVAEHQRPLGPAGAGEVVLRGLAVRRRPARCPRRVRRRR